MLRFTRKPDVAFHAIVRDSIGYALDRLTDTDVPDEDALSTFYGQTVKAFSRQELAARYRELLAAHESVVLFQPTDYHFLLLHDAISLLVELHNDAWLDDQKRFVSDVLVNTIDFEFIESAFFWDLDFLTPAEDMQRLSAEAKEMLRFNPEVFGLVHGLKPHPEEVRLVEVPVEGEWGGVEEAYRPNEDYPWVPPEEREDE